MQRFIELEPISGSPYLGSVGTGPIPPSARIVMQDFAGTAAPFFHVTVTGLLQAKPECYSVRFFLGSDEFASETTPALYVNSDSDGKLQMWSQLPSSDLLDAPVVTAIIAFEPDDGRQFDPALDTALIAFKGTSIL